MSLYATGVVGNYLKRTASMPLHTAVTLVGWFQIPSDQDQFQVIFQLGNGGFFALRVQADGTTLEVYDEYGTKSGTGSITPGTWYSVSYGSNGNSDELIVKSISGTTVINTSGTNATWDTGTLDLWLNGYTYGARSYAKLAGWKIFAEYRNASARDLELASLTVVNSSNVRGAWPMTDTASKANNLVDTTGTGNLTETGTAHAVDSDLPALANPTFEQEGFRFYNDDGGESASTPYANQDATAFGPLGTRLQLRVLINTSDDTDSTAFRLEFKKSTDSEWEAVAAAIAAQAASWGAIGTGASGTTSAAPSYPAGMNAAQAVFLAITGRSNTAGTAATATGFSNVSGGALEGGTGTWGVDVGTRRAQLMRKDTVTGSESGTLTVSLAGTTANTLRASLFRIPIPAGYTLDVACASGADTSNGTAYSATTGALDLQPGDLLVLVTAQNLDSGTATNRAVSASGISFSAITNRADNAVTNGNDHRHIINTASVNSGSGNVAVTFSYTCSGNCSGPTVIMRLRLVPIAKAVILDPSANIAAGGVNTTARLTPPSGKTTANFTAGRMADDENPLDAVNVAEDFYTEVGWVINTQAPAANGDSYNFRVTANGTPLNTYSVTPTLTLQLPAVLEQYRYRWYNDDGIEAA